MPYIFFQNANGRQIIFCNRKPLLSCQFAKKIFDFSMAHAFLRHRCRYIHDLDALIEIDGRSGGRTGCLSGSAIPFFLLVVFFFSSAFLCRKRFCRFLGIKQIQFLEHLPIASCQCVFIDQGIVLRGSDIIEIVEAFIGQSVLQLFLCRLRQVRKVSIANEADVVEIADLVPPLVRACFQLANSVDCVDFYKMKQKRGAFAPKD